MKKLKGVLIDKGLDEVRGFDKIDPAGVKFQREEIPVTVDFDQRKVIGKAKPYVKDGKIYADIRLAASVLAEKTNMGSYGIGYRTIRSEIKDGVNYVKEAKIYEVSVLSGFPDEHRITALPPDT